MKPGLELDRLAAEAMGWKGIERALILPHWWGWPPGQESGIKCLVPQYSTGKGAVMEAFEWLEQNNPWGGAGLMVGKVEEFDDGGKVKRLGVFLLKDDCIDMGVLYDLEKIAVGETYPHAICLAILEVGKGKK